MLAHELRNPLSTVCNGIAVLKLTQQPDSQLADVVNMMDNHASHLVRMIDDLLDVSRVTQGKIVLKTERLEVSTLISLAVKGIEPQYESRGKLLHTTALPTGLFVEGDPTRLTQVINNLLTNSLRYTGDDGQVWVSLEMENQEALIKVKDNGIGLTTEQQTSVFELFVQGDNSLARSQGGLGVGLTLVKRLVEMHGGKVEARSQGLGLGSEFLVYLPLLNLPAQEQASRLDEGGQKAPLRILVIDDVEDLAKVTSMLLSIKGYQVDICTSGIEGVKAVEQSKPSVVLCDIGMPGLDGYQTAQLMRQGEWGRKVILIALSGYAQPDDVQKAKEAGFDTHLAKPVDIDQLQSAILKLTRS
ncbi:ATP-binding protein [Dyadobacter sp. 676]|uniref:histidine kinase n=1 Tax=Dyadobacter sp. 676 TaxID=3088362 RepID=A0AAU8FG82_9BACT